MAKFSITFKDPDYSVSSGSITTNQSGSGRALVQSFLQWNEYVTIEFDTTTKTARVVPVAEI